MNNEPELPPPLTEFPPFPRLPTELRLLIWHHALPDRAIIETETTFFVTKEGYYDLPCNDDRHIVVDARTVPSIFHACRESRETCLATYTQGFQVLGGENGWCSHTLTKTITVQGKDVDVPRRDIYWRPKVDVIRVQERARDHQDDEGYFGNAACALIDSDAPSGGLHAVGVQRVILPMTFFMRETDLWDPRICGYTWGMETVYIILRRNLEDTPQDFEEHLAWFGRWWWDITSAWREVVEEDAPLAMKVPFLPRLIWLLEYETLESRHLDQAIECMLVDEDEQGTDFADADEEFESRRYGPGYPGVWL